MPKKKQPLISPELEVIKSRLIDNLGLRKTRGRYIDDSNGEVELEHDEHVCRLYLEPKLKKEYKELSIYIKFYLNKDLSLKEIRLDYDLGEEYENVYSLSDRGRYLNFDKDIEDLVEHLKVLLEWVNR